jgi:hypothetical protein
MMTPKEKVEWAERRMRLRSRIVRIMDRLRDEGEIDSLDLDRLYNFTQVMLMLLSKVQPGVLNAAIKEAEIAAWVQGGVYDVIMDEELIK